MAENPIKTDLPADLPENWEFDQTIYPDGEAAGFDEQHGYNYLMRQVNNAQKAIKEIGEYLEHLQVEADRILNVLSIAHGGTGASDAATARSNLGLGDVDNTHDKDKTVKKAGEADAVEWSGVRNKPASYPPSSHTHAYLPLSGGTITGPVNIKGAAASNPLKVRGIVGCLDDGATLDALHLQYGVNAPTYFGNTAAYSISADGGTYTGKAATAGTATVSLGVQDYNNAANTIRIGFSGTDLSGSDLAYIVGCTSDKKYHTASKAGVQSYLGLGSAAYKGTGDFAAAGHTHNLSTLINALSEGTATPEDKDYYVSQYVGGGTSTTTYHRRPMSALWAYIKGKADSIYQAKGSYAASNHTHKSVIDNNNGSSATTFCYSKAGMNYADYTWLAAWNGYELRAVNKSQFAQASHSHSVGTTGAFSGVSASGSNYVRFSDGTQICWTRVQVNSTDFVTWTFPVAFANSEYAIVFMGTSNTWSPAYISAKYSSGVSCYWRTGNAYNTVAVGRWK